MRLSRQQFKQLQLALLDAFPTTAFLEQMLAFDDIGVKEESSKD